MSKDPVAQVKSWSDTELNRKIAELMGFRADFEQDREHILLFKDKGVWVITSGEGQTEELLWEHVPNYCNDAFASLRAQEEACEADEETYIVYMNKVLWGECINLDYKHAARIANAEHRQRAEASYLTLSYIKTAKEAQNEVQA